MWTLHCAPGVVTPSTVVAVPYDVGLGCTVTATCGVPIERGTTVDLAASVVSTGAAPVAVPVSRRPVSRLLQRPPWSMAIFITGWISHKVPPRPTDLLGMFLVEHEPAGDAHMRAGERQDGRFRAPPGMPRDHARCKLHDHGMRTAGQRTR